MTPIPIDWSDLYVASRTVYGEARGESPEGKLAVACVIMNRVRGKKWFGNTIKKVCSKPFQFSCWNAKDPNRALIEKATISQLEAYGCVGPVLQALHTAGTDADPTRGACHYHRRGITPPRWARGRKPDVEIGNHVFYVGIS